MTNESNQTPDSIGEASKRPVYDEVYITDLKKIREKLQDDLADIYRRLNEKLIFISSGGVALTLSIAKELKIKSWFDFILISASEVFFLLSLLLILYSLWYSTQWHDLKLNILNTMIVHEDASELQNKEDAYSKKSGFFMKIIAGSILLSIALLTAFVIFHNLPVLEDEHSPLMLDDKEMNKPTPSTRPSTPAPGTKTIPPRSIPPPPPKVK